MKEFLLSFSLSLSAAVAAVYVEGVIQLVSLLFHILIYVTTINICHIILYSEALLTTGKTLKIIQINKNIILLRTLTICTWYTQTYGD